MGKFQGKVALITGAASGIGLAATRMFAAGGAIVAMNDLPGEALEKAVASIRDAGGKADALPGNLVELDNTRKLVKTLVENHGQIDILVNNAGVGATEDSPAVTLESWRRILSLNLEALFFLTQAVAIDSMIPQQSGTIVNVASLAGLFGSPQMAAYVASKHGVAGLTKALAVEWGRLGIRVNAVCPGITETPILKSWRTNHPERFASRINRIPLGHAATAEDQARAILFLADPENTSVNGVALNIDGGSGALSSGFTPSAL